MPIATEHFTWQELGNPPLRLRTNGLHLAQHLELLRRIAGNKPLRIVSGYRSPSHNRAVGGAADSQHLYARAADIPAGYCSVQEAIWAGFTGIGSRGQWAVHVDVRPGPLTRWVY